MGGALVLLLPVPVLDQIQSDQDLAAIDRSQHTLTPTDKQTDKGLVG
jgi:hypothetical protein